VQVSSTGSFGNFGKAEREVSMRDVMVEGKGAHEGAVEGRGL
jgi:hypothetical protein